MSEEYTYKIGHMVMLDSIDGAILLGESIEGLTKAGSPPFKACALREVLAPNRNRTTSR